MSKRACFPIWVVLHFSHFCTPFLPIARNSGKTEHLHFAFTRLHLSLHDIKGGRDTIQVIHIIHSANASRSLLLWDSWGCGLKAYKIRSETCLYGIVWIMWHYSCATDISSSLSTRSWPRVQLGCSHLLPRCKGRLKPSAWGRLACSTPKNSQFKPLTTFDNLTGLTLVPDQQWIALRKVPAWSNIYIGFAQPKHSI